MTGSPNVRLEYSWHNDTWQHHKHNNVNNDTRTPGISSINKTDVNNSSNMNITRKQFKCLFQNQQWRPQGGFEDGCWFRSILTLFAFTNSAPQLPGGPPCQTLVAPYWKCSISYPHPDIHPSQSYPSIRPLMGAISQIFHWGVSEIFYHFLTMRNFAQAQIKTWNGGCFQVLSHPTQTGGM